MKRMMEVFDEGYRKDTHLIKDAGLSIILKSIM